MLIGSKFCCSVLNSADAFVQQKMNIDSKTTHLQWQCFRLQFSPSTLTPNWFQVPQACTHQMPMTQVLGILVFWLFSFLKPWFLPSNFSPKRKVSFFFYQSQYAPTPNRAAMIVFCVEQLKKNVLTPCWLHVPSSFSLQRMFPQPPSLVPSSSWFFLSQQLWFVERLIYQEPTLLCWMHR